MRLKILAAALAGTLAASPSMAVITGFAGFTSTTDPNFKYTKTSNSSATIANIVSNANPVSVPVNFYFQNSSLASIGTIAAKLKVVASTTQAVYGVNGQLSESAFGGSFVFTNATTLYTPSSLICKNGCAAGTVNLLTGTFTGGALSGMLNAQSGSLSDSTTGGGSITYTSDLLSFVDSAARSFGMTYDPIKSGNGTTGLVTTATGTSTPFPGVTVTSYNAFNNFSARASGLFSSDPAPSVVDAVPEPASWALMLGGFGLLGATMRRRRVALNFS